MNKHQSLVISEKINVKNQIIQLYIFKVNFHVNLIF
jgi:hypothetical protein